MDKGHIRCHVLDLVCLQVSDEMPFDILREDFVFLCHLLHLAFAEDALSGIVSLLEGFDGMVLRHSYQADAFGKLRLDTMYFFLYSSHGCGWLRPFVIQSEAKNLGCIKRECYRDSSLRFAPF